jgi:hypothetical protein
VQSHTPLLGWVDISLLDFTADFCSIRRTNVVHKICTPGSRSVFYKLSISYPDAHQKEDWQSMSTSLASPSSLRSIPFMACAFFFSSQTLCYPFNCLPISWGIDSYTSIDNFGCCCVLQLILVPEMAWASLPPTSADVTEFSPASAGHMVAAESQFNDRMTAGACLPSLCACNRLHLIECRIVRARFSVMSTLLAVSAYLRQAGTATSSTALDILDRSKEERTGWVGTIETVRSRGAVFRRFLPNCNLKIVG